MNTNNEINDTIGIVTKINPPYIFVHTCNQVVRCSMSAAARGRADEVNGYSLIVGDKVRCTLLPDGNGNILGSLPRRNTLSRRSAVPMPGAHAHEQVIAANLDLVMPVFSAANPAPRWNLLDRYLVLAEKLEVPALICITKSDLAMDANGELAQDLGEVLAVYQRIGYQTVITSAQKGRGIEQLRQALDGKVTVLLGKSGVGKTSLMNALQPGLGLRINEVNRTTGKGRHTTSHSEMFSLDSGGSIIDTPGIREFGLWDIQPEDLAFCFPEIHPLVGTCRFGLSCRHLEEPDCAVRNAVMTGKISPYRYHSYTKLILESGLS